MESVILSGVDQPRISSLGARIMERMAVRGSLVSGRREGGGVWLEVSEERTIVGVERVGGGFEERVGGRIEVRE